jgi:hypothetical protein
MTSLMTRRPVECEVCKRIDPERADRLVAALLANLNDWIARTDEIATNAIPVTGNLGRAVSLSRDMQQCKASLRRLAGLTDP